MHSKMVILDSFGMETTLNQNSEAILRHPLVGLEFLLRLILYFNTW